MHEPNATYTALGLIRSRNTRNAFYRVWKGSLPGHVSHIKYVINPAHGQLLAIHVIVLNKITHPEHRRNGWRLCLQWARYQYDDKSEPETGYRFIWRRPDGSLQPARGQARIPRFPPVNT
jgi:hypothetical protein